MAVHFQLAESTNYSTKFLSCRRLPSPYPGHERRKCTSFTRPKHGSSMSTCFNAIKHFFKDGHRHPNVKKAPNTSSPKSSLERKVEREANRKADPEWKAARRNAMDLGSRRPCNGRSLCPYHPFEDPYITLSEEDSQGVPMDLVRCLELGIASHEGRVLRTEEVSRWEDDVVEDPFWDDVRTFGHVLAWMHGHGVNAAGFETTERERRECGEGRCRCLGPLARDV